MELTGHIKHLVGWVSKETRTALSHSPTQENKFTRFIPVIQKGSSALRKMERKIQSAQREMMDAAEELTVSQKEKGILLERIGQTNQALNGILQERDQLLTTLNPSDFATYMHGLEAESDLRKELRRLQDTLSIAGMRLASAEERLSTAEKDLRRLQA